MNIIVDLDGTLCRFNSFRNWTIAAFLIPSFALGFLYPISLLIFFTLYLLRVLKLISHLKMKTTFISLFNLFAGDKKREEFNLSFANSIIKNGLNSSVLTKIEELKNEFDIKEIVLATAAPEFYAKHIANKFNMSLVASGFTKDDSRDIWIETIKVEKEKSVEQIIGNSSYVVFTDHEDDWPLIKKSQNCYLVNPTKKVMELATANQINFELLS
jgi:hypothetical protein